MILIADSGSTKTDWVLIDDKNKSNYKTVGYNPYFVNTENIYNSLNETLVPQLNSRLVKKVYFYGAGCSNLHNNEIVKKALLRCFPNAEIEVNHDMLAAARAVLGTKRGFTAIIGTGSNTCIYNGKNIEKNIDSLGYLLGDEGSGSHIGKKIIRDYLRGYLPKDLNERFKEKYNLTSEEVFNNLYNKPLPNRFLAGFCKFADEHSHHEYIHQIVRESFQEFFRQLVSKYPNYEKFSFNCIGSVGFIFKNILKDVAKEYKMDTGEILHSPIDNLVEYHLIN